MKVVWSPLAEQRALEAVEYIAQDRPQRTAAWFEKPLERVGNLSSSRTKVAWSARSGSQRIGKCCTNPIESFIASMLREWSFSRSGACDGRGTLGKWLTRYDDMLLQAALCGIRSVRAVSSIRCGRTYRTRPEQLQSDSTRQ